MILVTGATGFIGSHLVERLNSQGRAVRCLVRRKDAGLPAGVQPVLGDLAGAAGLAAALQGVDTVIHLAGATKARVPSDYERGNVTATRNLLQAAGSVRRFVHVSSLAAAGPSSADRPVGEDDIPHPVSAYGRSKLAGEKAARDSQLRDRLVIVRPPVVYGPRDRDVFQMIQAASRGWMLQIGSAPRQFSLIYVIDLVDGLIAAADAPGAAGRTFHLAYATPFSWGEFGLTAARVLGRKLRAVAVPETAAYALGWCAERWSRFSEKPVILSRDKIAEACCPGWVCDSSRAASELGFRAATGLEQGLKQTIEWYREAGWLKP